jgi:autoinducer 2 (AI-2) kinase
MSEQELRQEIIAVIDELYDAGLITSTGGNISARIDDEPDAFLITPTMQHKGGLRIEDVVKVDGTGKPAHRRQRPSVETLMHLAIYAADPDVEAVIHSHASLATALGLVGGRIPPITVDAAPFVDTRIVPYGLPGDEDLIDRVVEALAHSPAALLQNHGLITVGWTVRHAASRALAFEETVRIMLACRLLDDATQPATLSEDTVALLQMTGLA